MITAFNPICFKLLISLHMQGVPHDTKKNHFFNIIATIEFEILLFGQNYLLSNITNTIYPKNINIVTAFS